MNRQYLAVFRSIFIIRHFDMHFRVSHIVILFCLFFASCQRASQKHIFVELDSAEGISSGTEMRCRGVVTGHVESVAIDKARQLPVAKLILAENSPLLQSTDSFRITSSSLLGDRFIEVIPAKSPGTPLANAATVRSSDSGFNINDQIAKTLPQTLGDLGVFQSILELPEPKRGEVMEKIRKLVDESKKESSSK